MESSSKALAQVLGQAWKSKKPLSPATGFCGPNYVKRDTIFDVFENILFSKGTGAR